MFNLTVGRHLETAFVRGYGSENTDQRLVYFHLVAGTCPTNSSHAATSIIWGDKSPGLVPRIQTRFEFVGQVAGTKFWSLRLNVLMKMGSSHEGSWSPGLVAGTSPFVCADLKTFRLLVRMLYHWATGDSWELRPLISNWLKKERKIQPTAVPPDTLPERCTMTMHHEISARSSLMPAGDGSAMFSDTLSPDKTVRERKVGP